MSTEPARPPAVVLCGGTSQRMGRDKALVEFSGKPMVARMHAALEPLFGGVALSVSGREQEMAVRAVLQGGAAVTHKVRYIHDAVSGRGPLEGVRSALVELDVEYAFFVAVDMSAAVIFPVGVVSELWAAVRDSRCRGAVPTWGGQIEPAFAFYSRELLPDIDAALARGERSLRQIAEWAGVLRVPVRATADDFANINTPEDLARVERLATDRLKKQLDKRREESDP